jgi:parvulin-like peptidyl-prolyl isomerase
MNAAWMKAAWISALWMSALWMRALWMSAALAVLAPSSVMAMLTEDLDDPALLAEINGTPLSYQGFEMLYRVVATGKGAMSRQQLLESTIEARLLALFGEQTLSKQYLLETTAVGYPVTELLHDEVVGIFRLNYQRQFTDFLEKQFGGRLENLVLISPVLAKMVPAPDQALQLDHQLDDNLAQRYKQIVVAETAPLQGTTRSLNLLQLFESQNIQGKISIRRADLDFIQNQAVIALSKQYFIDWLQAQGLVKAGELEGIQRLVRDKHVKSKVLLHYGLNNDIHDDNPVLQKAWQLVSRDEIKAWYDAHKEQFQKILYVDARHIRLQNEAQARVAQKALISGLNFTDAVKQYSIAEDRHSPVPGSLGRIHAKDEKDWLHTAIFALKEGTVSRPFRSPQAEGKAVVWEIFHIDKKAIGYHSVDSETVRYIAGKQVAMENLKRDFRLLREKLFEEARIRLNPRLMSAPGNP